MSVNNNKEYVKTLFDKKEVEQLKEIAKNKGVSLSKLISDLIKTVYL